MYNQSYDDYIRSVLGYPNTNSQDYYSPYIYNEQNMYDYNQNRNTELEDYYPEIYKIVYPMVQKICQNGEISITKDNVDRMVEEIYSNIEGNDTVYLNINLNNNIENINSVQLENREENKAVNNRSVKSSYQEPRTFNGKKVKEEPKRENRGDGESREKRNFQNNTLRDIIKILILRELIGRNDRPGNRPPFPPQGRPPFPPNRPGRPPYYRDYGDIYEY